MISVPFTTDRAARKEQPVCSGVFDYFPNALMEVAQVSFIGNKQHNPGQPLHWAKEKSTDHADCIGRHLMERGTRDDDGMRHSAKLAWRALANLQIEIEAEAKEVVPLREGAQKACTPTCPDCAKVEARKPGSIIGLDPAALGGDQSVVTIAPAFSAGPLIVGEGFYFEEVPHPDIELLTSLSCKPTVAKQIVAGSSYCDFGGDISVDRFVYVAGPMRGYEKFNFPAFDATRDTLLRKGWNVISPADIDRACGDTNENTGAVAKVTDYVYRDFFALFFNAHQEGKNNGAIAMLPGWEKSTGAVAEFFMARWLGLKVLNSDGNLLHPSSVNYIDLNAAVEKFLISQWEN